MAFANSAITDIIATTIQSRSGELADNLTQNNAILQRLQQKGNVRPFSGGNVILEEIMYDDSATNNANSYSGYEVLNIAPDSPISAAQYKIAQYADAVTMSGLEMLQNSSKEAIIDLLDGRMQVSEARLLNRISGDLYGDGTGNGGKNLDGLGAAVAAVPTSGTLCTTTYNTRETRKELNKYEVPEGHGAIGRQELTVTVIPYSFSPSSDLLILIALPG